MDDVLVFQKDKFIYLKTVYHSEIMHFLHFGMLNCLLLGIEDDNK